MFQTGFFMHWAETTEILGRAEKFPTGTPQFILRGRGYSKYTNTVRTLRIRGSVPPLFLPKYVIKGTVGLIQIDSF